MSKQNKREKKESYESEKERVKQGFNVTPLCMYDKNLIISSLDIFLFFVVSVCLNICVVVVDYQT